MRHAVPVCTALVRFFRSFYQGNDGAIDHLFAGIFKIYRYIHPNNGLHLTGSPMRAVWMIDKIAKLKKEHL